MGYSSGSGPLGLATLRVTGRDVEEKEKAFGASCEGLIVFHVIQSGYLKGDS
jgi:hypothetical protein